METSRTKTKTSFISRGMDGEEEGCERAKGKANTHHQGQTARALAPCIEQRGGGGGAGLETHPAAMVDAHKPHTVVRHITSGIQISGAKYGGSWLS
jgi:hypothetical protein